MISEIFNLILYQPLFNVLILLYQYLPGRDFGLSIIVLTVLIRFLLYPFGKQAVKSQKVISDLQPKIKEINEKYKTDPEKRVKLTLELYQKSKVNPVSSFLPLLIQLPVLIALYRLFWKGVLPQEMVYLYSFVPDPGAINTTFFGIMDLAKPSMILAALAGVSQFFQTKLFSPKTEFSKKNAFDFSELLQKQMLYFFPVLTFIILISLPSAIGLYWIVSTLFSLVQQYFVSKEVDRTANSG